MIDSGHTQVELGLAVLSHTNTDKQGYHYSYP